MADTSTVNMAMNIIVCDDEAPARRLLRQMLEKVAPNATVKEYGDPEEVIAQVLAFQPQVAFLDIQMPGMSGITLAKALKRLVPELNVIFVTGYDNYALEAFSIHASGYLLKPVRSTDVLQELENLRVTPQLENSRGLFLKTFGVFEVFCNGSPVTFKYEKTRELVAYLFDCGGSFVSNGEIAAMLWENEGHESYLRRIRKDASDAFAQVGYPEIIKHRRGFMALDMTDISSDYQSWMKGEPSGLNAYRGQYMSQYSWAETTNALFQ